MSHFGIPVLWVIKDSSISKILDVSGSPPNNTSLYLYFKYYEITLQIESKIVNIGCNSYFWLKNISISFPFFFYSIKSHIISYIKLTGTDLINLRKE